MKLVFLTAASRPVLGGQDRPPTLDTGNNDHRFRGSPSSWLKPSEEVEAEFIMQLDYLSSTQHLEQPDSIQGWAVITLQFDDLERSTARGVDSPPARTSWANVYPWRSTAPFQAHHHMGTVCQTVEETTRLMENTDPKYSPCRYRPLHFRWRGSGKDVEVR